MNKNLILLVLANLLKQNINVNTIAKKLKNQLSRSEVFKAYYQYKKTIIVQAITSHIIKVIDGKGKLENTSMFMFLFNERISKFKLNVKFI
jgi:hypothetical protein